MKNVSNITEIHIPTKREVLLIAGGIIIVATLISTILIYWWIGLTVSILFDCFYLREFYPNISMARAKRIIRGSRICRERETRVPCSAHYIKSIAQRNIELHRENKTFRWFLANSSEFLENHTGETAIEKIKSQECFFFTEEYYSEAYAEEIKKIRQIKKAIREQKAANR